MAALDRVALKAYIQNAIYDNTTEDITGDILQDVLDKMVDSLLASVDDVKQYQSRQWVAGTYKPGQTVNYNGLLLQQAGDVNLASSDIRAELLAGQWALIGAPAVYTQLTRNITRSIPPYTQVQVQGGITITDGSTLDVMQHAQLITTEAINVEGTLVADGDIILQ